MPWEAVRANQRYIAEGSTKLRIDTEKLPMIDTMRPKLGTDSARPVVKHTKTTRRGIRCLCVHSVEGKETGSAKGGMYNKFEGNAMMSNRTNCELQSLIHIEYIHTENHTHGLNIVLNTSDEWG